MAIVVHFTVDYRDFTELKDRALRIGRVRDSFAHKIAEQIKTRAQQYAPKDTGELAASAEVTRHGTADYSVSFERTAPWKNGPGGEFDVAQWTHEAEYTPSTPGTGRLYLERAIEEETDGIELNYSLILDEFFA